MRKFMIAAASAVAMFCSAFAADQWFNADIGSYTSWPTNNAAFGGSWSDNAGTVASLTGDTPNTLEVAATTEAPLTFTATDAKDLADGSVTITSKIEFTPFSTVADLPAPNADAKAGIVAVKDGNFWVLSADTGADPKTNKWTETSVATVTSSVGTSIALAADKDSATSYTATYTINGTTLDAKPIVVPAVTVSAVNYSGDGIVSSLSATIESAGVIEVGGQKYKTFEAAITAADAGATLTLLKGLTLTQRVDVGKTVTINLNGNTIIPTATCSNHSAFNVTAGTLTITNGVIDATAIAESAGETDAITVRSGATVNLGENLTIKINSKNGACVYAFAGGCANIFGGTYINNTEETYQYNPNFKAMLVNQANNTDQLISITGGSFKGQNPATGDDSGEPSTFLAADYYSWKQDDGSWLVNDTAPAAKIGTELYLTLQEAANVGGDIVVCKDLTLEARVDTEKDATFNLNGKKITTTATCGNGSAFNVKSGKVTIKNGSIDGTQVTETECDAITVRAGAEATLEDLAITVNSKNGACAYAFDGGKATIKSGAYTNLTEEIYQFNPNFKGMLVNQANVATQLVFVEGGTFKGQNPATGDDAGLCTTFLASGYYSWKQTDGTWLVNDTVPGAKIGDVYYLTLQDALNAGGKVELLADVDVHTTGVTVPADTTVDLDLAGFTVTAANTATGHFQVNGTLSITNSTGDGKIVSGENGTYGVIQLANAIGDQAASLTLNGGTIRSFFDWDTGWGLHPSYGVVLKGNGSTLTINNGTVFTGYTAVMDHGAKSKNTVITINGGTIQSLDHFAIAAASTSGTINVKGGTIQGGKGAFCVKTGTVNVEGGTLKSKMPEEIGESWIADPEAVVWVSLENGNATVSLLGGTYTADPATTPILSYIEVAGKTATITKGAGVNIPAPEDYKWDENGQLVKKVYTVILITNAGAETKYETFAEAYTAAAAGDTIKLCADIETATKEQWTIAKNITIDFNGKTITKTIANDWVFTVANGATVVFQDSTGNVGGIKHYPTQKNQSSPASMIQNKGNLTIKSGKYESDFCVIKNDEDPGAGVLTVDGGVFTVAAAHQGYTGKQWALMNWAKATINGGTWTGVIGTRSCDGNAVSKFGTTEIAGNLGTGATYLLFVGYPKDTTYANVPKIKGVAKSAVTLDKVDTITDELELVEDGDYVTVAKKAAPTVIDFVKVSGVEEGVTLYTNDLAGAFAYAGSVGTALVELTNNVDLASANWTPVSGFKGSFNGNGFEIRNMTVNATAAEAGFFSKLPNKNVMNVTFVNPTVTSTQGYVGVLAGDGDYSPMVSNVTVCGKISVTSGGDYVSALVGHGKYAHFVDCHVNGGNTADSVITGNAKVGGLWGMHSEGAYKLLNCTVKYVTVATATKIVGAIAGRIHYGDQLIGCSAENVIVKGKGTEATVGLLVGRVENENNVSVPYFINCTATSVVLQNLDGTPRTSDWKIYGDLGVQNAVVSDNAVGDFSFTAPKLNFTAGTFTVYGCGLEPSSTSGSGVTNQCLRAQVADGYGVAAGTEAGTYIIKKGFVLQIVDAGGKADITVDGAGTMKFVGDPITGRIANVAEGYNAYVFVAGTKVDVAADGSFSGTVSEKSADVAVAYVKDTAWYLDPFVKNDVVMYKPGSTTPAGYPWENSNGRPGEVVLTPDGTKVYATSTWSNYTSCDGGDAGLLQYSASTIAGYIGCYLGDPENGEYGNNATGFRYTNLESFRAVVPVANKFVIIGQQQSTITGAYGGQSLIFPIGGDWGDPDFGGTVAGDQRFWSDSIINNGTINQYAGTRHGLEWVGAGVDSSVDGIVYLGIYARNEITKATYTAIEDENGVVTNVVLRKSGIFWHTGDSYNGKAANSMARWTKGGKDIIYASLNDGRLVVLDETLSGNTYTNCYSVECGEPAFVESSTLIELGNVGKTFRTISVVGKESGTPHLIGQVESGATYVFALSADGKSLLSTEPICLVNGTDVCGYQFVSLASLDDETMAYASHKPYASAGRPLHIVTITARPANVIVRSTFSTYENGENNEFVYGDPCETTFTAPAGKKITGVKVNGVADTTFTASSYTFESAALTENVYIQMTTEDLPVAKIGTTYYLTLNDAFDAAKGVKDVEIELLSDVKMTSKYVIENFDGTLNLGGFSVTNDESWVLTTYDWMFDTTAQAQGNNKMLIKNGTIYLDERMMYVREGWEVTLAADATIISHATGKTANTVRIFGGTLNVYGTINLDADYEASAIIDVPIKNSIVNVYDGASLITDGGWGYKVGGDNTTYPELTVYGGTITINSTYPVFNCYSGNHAKIDIRGGTFKRDSLTGSLIALGGDKNMTVVPLTKATCSAKFKNMSGVNQWCATGYVSHLGEDGYYFIDDAIAATGIALDKETAVLTLEEGKAVTTKLTATITPTDADIKATVWTSSDTGVAVVTNGTITAVAAGDATITVKVIDYSGNEFSKTCAVTVKSGIEPINPDVPTDPLPSKEAAEAVADTINANKETMICTPEGATASEYTALFTAVVKSDNSVVVELNETGTNTLETSATKLTEAVTDLGDSSKTTVSIAPDVADIVPGFYYGIGVSTEVGGQKTVGAGKWKQATNAGLDTLSADKPTDSNKGFFQVQVSVKQPN